MKYLKWIYFLLPVAWVSCSEPTIIGEDFVDSSDFELSLIDTISLDFHTIKFDSIQTSQTSRLLIGNALDTELGDVNAEAYFLFEPNLSRLFIDDDFLFDSLTISLEMDGYSVYLEEEGTYASLILERLPTTLEFRDDGKLYNISDVVEDGDFELLVEQEFYWEKDRVQEKVLRLPDYIGLELFEFIEEDDDVVQFSSDLHDYLRGFRLRFKEEDAPLVGFHTDSVRMTLHMTDVGVANSEEITYEFEISNAPYFTHIDQSNVRESLAVEGLDDWVHSNDTDGITYISGGLGYSVLIDLENIRNIQLNDDEFIIIQSELRLQWFTTDQDEFPEILEARLVDEDFNNLLDTFLPLTREYDDEYERDNFYVLSDISGLIDFIIDQPFEDEHYLLLSLEDFNASLTYLPIGDQSFNSELTIQIIDNNDK